MDLQALLGFANVALFAVAVLLALGGAVVAFYGPRLVDARVKGAVEHLRSDIEKRLKEKEEETRKETQARLQMWMGYIFGELHRIHPDKEEFVDYAIEFSRHAFSALSDERKALAINNLTFYLAERGQVRDAKEAVSHAEELLDLYQKERDPDYLTTYARVLIAYHSSFADPAKVLREAICMLDELQKDKSVSENHKEKARPRAARLAEILRAIGPDSG